MKNVTTILFDFDGTVADTLPVVFGIVNEMLIEAGRPPVPLADLEIWRAKTARKFYFDLGIPLWRAPQMLSRVQAALAGRMKQLPAFPGMEELTQTLKRRNYRLGVVSSNTRNNLEDFFSAHHFAPFDFMYCDSSIFGKAMVLRRLFSRYRINSDEVIYVADEARDIDAARTVDMPIISVTWGYNSAATLSRLRPDYIVSSSRELATLLLKE